MCVSHVCCTYVHNVSSSAETSSDNQNTKHSLIQTYLFGGFAAFLFLYHVGQTEESGRQLTS